jgi:hypothetical protein
VHPIYQSLIRERVRYAIAAARAIQPLEHSGVKGAIREVLMADLFRPLLPADIGVATGVLISAIDQRQSGQQDIIVFNKRILPPILFEQGPAIVPVESALVSIEVKSKLTATELQLAHESAVTVLNLGMHSGTRDATGNRIDSRASAVSSFLLALDTDLTPGGKTEVQRYKEYLGENHPVLSGICVVGRTSWWPTERVIYNLPSKKYFKEDGAPITGEWREVPSDANHSEVLELIGGILDLVERIGLSRGRPSLYSYLE